MTTRSPVLASPKTFENTEPMANRASSEDDSGAWHNLDPGRSCNLLETTSLEVSTDQLFGTALRDPSGSAPRRMKATMP